MLKSYLYDLEASVKGSENLSMKQKGILFGFTKPLVHNDLLAGNLLLTNSEEEGEDTYITLIDYEYGSYNFRGYDIANHFNGMVFNS